MEFKQTWRGRVTPSGIRYSEHTASAHRTSASDCSGSPAYAANWPTPTTSDAGRGGVSERANGERMNLLDYAQLSSWNTPRATDGSKGGPNQAGGALPADAALASWATPAARDWKSGDASEATIARNARPLNEQAVNLAGWATPMAQNPEAGNCDFTRSVEAAMGLRESKNAPLMVAGLGPTPSSSPAATGSSGESRRAVLNPAFSGWLMGYPVSWVVLGQRALICTLFARRKSPAASDSSGGSATRSSRKRQRSSSRRSAKSRKTKGGENG